MGKTLYLECNSGISGDMTVAALLDLGADENYLKEVLSTIPVQGFEIEISKVKKSGIAAKDFAVKLDAAHENHDHDMEYLHGHEHHHEHDHEHHHEHGHEHHHEHEHHHHHGSNMAYVTDVIQHTKMTERAMNMAIHIFEVLAEAEAKAHGIPIDEVHFHEVGAVDSIVDIIAIAVCMDNLGVEEMIVPKLCEGTGTVRCQHGILPIPVPAVSNILQAHEIAMEVMECKGEFITPTGAAFVAALRTGNKLPKEFVVEKIGLGAGKREYERPSILRAMLIRPMDNKASDTICKLECNVDDATGEMLGYAMECLLKAGARDVYYQPIYMKKNRPAWMLNVICDEEKIPAMEEIIFRETTTIGIRRVMMERTILPREMTSVETSYGMVDVKKCTLPDGSVRYYPEYDSVTKICREKEVGYQTVYQEAVYNLR